MFILVQPVCKNKLIKPSHISLWHIILFVRVIAFELPDCLRISNQRISQSEEGWHWTGSGGLFFFNDFYNPLSLPSPALPVLPFPISFLLAPLTPPSSSSLLSSSSSLARHCFLSLSASTHQSPSALCVDAFSQHNSITSEHVQPPHHPPPHLCSLHHHHHLSLGS